MKSKYEKKEEEKSAAAVTAIPQGVNDEWETASDLTIGFLIT